MTDALTMEYLQAMACKNRLKVYEQIASCAVANLLTVWSKLALASEELAVSEPNHERSYELCQNAALALCSASECEAEMDRCAC